MLKKSNFNKSNNEQTRYPIVEKKEAAPNVYKFVIKAPEIAKKAQPGQFIIVMSDEKSERIPITLSDWDVQTGEITVFVQEVGLSTTKMAFMCQGDQFYSVVGPLGKPAVVGEFGTVVLGGGCFGIGAIYPIAKRLKELGNTVICIIEGRSAYILYNEAKLQAVCDELIVGTKDGSKGRKGYIPEILQELIDVGRTIDHVKVIGCLKTMWNVAKITHEYKIKTMATFSTIMIDGTGMCGGCRLSVKDETVFACVDGPEFDAHEADWEELIKRKQSFLEDETLAYQNFSPECRALQDYVNETVKGD